MDTTFYTIRIPDEDGSIAYELTAPSFNEVYDLAIKYEVTEFVILCIVYHIADNTETIIGRNHFFSRKRKFDDI